MKTYVCMTPSGAFTTAEADNRELAEAVAALQLELPELPEGSLVVRVAGGAK